MAPSSRTAPTLKNGNHAVNETILEIQNVSKRFLSTQALKNVSLELKYGEVLALVGENGAGKSTLMKILSGAYPHDSYEGKVVLEGKECRFNTPRDSERVGIEMIYQEVSLILDLSIAENIFVGNYPVTKKIFMNWDEIYGRARTAMDLVGLKLDPREKVRNLSTSQQQMIAIARAVNKRPRILVLDEPTSALTENESEYLFSIIGTLRQSGISCIYISHKLKEVFRIANRICVLRDGEHIGTLGKDEFESNRIISMMIGRKIENMFPKSKIGRGEEILRVEHLSVPHKYIKGRNIVDDISFVLHKREILGIAGLVGAGRSELVNAVFGALRRNEGCRMYVEGKEVSIHSPRDAVKCGIALVTEDRRVAGIIPILSIRENITLVSLRKLFRTFLIKRTKEKKIANEFKERLSIKAPDVETKVRALSGGNQQKVVVSKWLLNTPKVLILDEPTRGIDVGAKFEVYNIMNELVKDDLGIIMISSELPEIIGMCDRVLVLANGKIVNDLTGKEIDETTIMSSATGTMEGGSSV